MTEEDLEANGALNGNCKLTNFKVMFDHICIGARMYGKVI